MEKDNIKYIIDILESKSAVDINNMTSIRDMSLIDDLMINSIEFYAILVDIEEKFNIIFKKVSIEAEEFETVGTLIDYVELLIKESHNKGETL